LDTAERFDLSLNDDFTQNKSAATEASFMSRKSHSTMPSSKNIKNGGQQEMILLRKERMTKTMKNLVISKW